MPNTKKARTPAYSLRFADETRRAGAEPDERGMMPLALARKIVASTEVFTRDGPPPGDTVWTALLSLADAAEFSREASRLTWSFPYLRGWDIEDAVIRWGSGALPWLEAMLDLCGGRVPGGPGAPFYFVGTHLLAVGPEAAKAVLRVERAGDSDPDRLGFVKDWLGRHGQPAWAALGELALAGDASAKRVLGALARRSPGSVRKQLGKDVYARVLGDALAALEASAVLAVLDAAAAADVTERVPWPTLVAGAGHFEYHAMRVVAARAKKGDDWGVLIEVVQGDVIGDEEDVRWPATIQQYTYGTRVPSGGAYLGDARPIPKGVARELDDARVAALDLRRGQSITGEITDWASVLALRAAVAESPDALFPPADQVVSKLGIARAEVLLDVRALEHVGGTANGKGALARLPSASPSWRSIADVIAARDPKRFDPGTPNTDWRLHAHRPADKPVG